MKKILTAILSIFYLIFFILSLLSLNATRGFGSIVIVPAFLMALLHIVFLFKKKTTHLFEIILVVCDIAFFSLPLLFLGSMMSIYMVFMQLIPLISSILLGVCVYLEKKKVE